MSCAATASRRSRRSCRGCRPCDLVLVEGYKREGHAKIEMRRLQARQGRTPLSASRPGDRCDRRRSPRRRRDAAGLRPRRHRGNRRFHRAAMRPCSTRQTRRLTLANKEGSRRMAKVAFLGLGVMGGPMAAHLQNKGGHHVTVYNRTAPRRRSLGRQAWRQAGPHPGRGCRRARTSSSLASAMTTTSAR